MAARIRKHHQDEARFYVYEVFAEDGSLLYVGKGSGKRAQISCYCKGGSRFEIVKRFASEDAAYGYEVELIAEKKPSLNICKGGNGSRATKKRQPRTPKWVKEIKAIGTRKYAAILWLKCRAAYKAAGIQFQCDESKVDAIREVAYG